jgi:hypothetical protein
MDDTTAHRIMRARMTLALVSARAKKCPRVCKRQRRCLARFGRWGDNFHDSPIPCAVMDAAEWAAIGLGMQMNIKRVQAYYEAKDEEREAAAPKISWEEKKRRWWSREEVEKRAALQRRVMAHPGYPIEDTLWQEVRGESLALPEDILETGEMLVKFMAERGCRCAIERRTNEDCFNGCVFRSRPPSPIACAPNVGCAPNRPASRGSSEVCASARRCDSIE